MRELERTRANEHWAEQERLPEETYVEGDEKPSRKTFRKEKSKEGKQRWRRRGIFVLLMALLATYLFLEHTSYGNGLVAQVTQVTDLTRQGEEEQVAPRSRGTQKSRPPAKRMRLRRKGRKTPPRSSRRKRRRTSTPRL